MPIAITIIKDEHRALASVLKGLEYLVAGIRNEGHAPDFTLMKSMLRYIEEFPDRLHHPKEDQYIFPALRRRDPSAAADLEILEAEHADGPAFIQRVAQALAAYEADAAQFGAFERAVAEYAQYQWDHMSREEDSILPKALQALLPEDWVEIDAAFKSNNDPLVGVGRQKEFRDLFRQVVNLMPAPMGLGPERR